ncbi:hypothetical protein SAMN02983003_1675 [Devosia enhydra]|uniref:Uncharacterized protein n=1 Tax=Devosia enhydra TaxID=665118 RepID=A0A1K2HYA2_9HYPH|nr:hypothetical protein [Devosia enhydra]SFZ83488.1 hypothetical protein SAMN02983003_1675 [Devosia enhydra]
MTKPFANSRSKAAVLVCSLIMLMAGLQPLQASSDGAWAEFEQDVQQACLSAALGTLAVTSIQVDPYGSESYGFALMVGLEAGTANERQVVCAYDKASQNAEISGLFER